MERIGVITGVQRGVLKAGENKVLSDPVRDMDPDVRAHLEQNVLAETHKAFIDAIKKSRGERLVAEDKVFTGPVWLGEQATEKVLADSLGSVQTVVRNVCKVIEAVNYPNRPVRVLG